VSLRRRRHVELRQRLSPGTYWVERSAWRHGALCGFVGRSAWRQVKSTQSVTPRNSPVMLQVPLQFNAATRVRVLLRSVIAPAASVAMHSA